ncbi:MAG: DUF5305 domain-containing protein [Halobacteriaceae archaeon]
MSDWSLRARALLDRQFAVAVGFCLVLLVAGAWVTYGAYGTDHVRTEQRVATTWSERTRFDHGATVREPNPVYPVGRTLSNRSYYFTRVSTWLNGSYVYGYEASDGGALRARTNLTLVVRSVRQPRSRDASPVVVWEMHRPLGNATATSLSPDETTRVPFAVNVSAVANHTAQVRERLGGTGETEVALVATTALSGTVNGHDVDRTRSANLSVTPEEGVYRVGDGGPWTAEHRTTESVAVPVDPGPLRREGGPALALVGAAGAGALVAARRRDALALSTAERDLLAYRDDRAEFDEWISTIRLPSAAFARPRAEASSLAALVDFAIDADTGVVEDPEDGTFYVVHDEFLYVYRPPPAATGLEGLASDAVRGRGDADGSTGAGGERDQADEAGSPGR